MKRIRATARAFIGRVRRAAAAFMDAEDRAVLGVLVIRLLAAVVVTITAAATAGLAVRVFIDTSGLW